MLRFKKILFLTLTIVLSNYSFGQKGTQSPYSSFGLGERSYEGYASFSSMGGLALGSTDSTIINSSNPASYSYITRHLPIFQLGMNGRISNFSTETTNTAQRHFGLNQFQLALPVKKNWGMGFGIKPYTFTGYTLSKYQVEDKDSTMLFVNEGSGGVRIANFGLSYKPLNIRDTSTIYIKSISFDTITKKKVVSKIPLKGYTTHRMSVGFNANYLFGTSEQIRSSEFIPSTVTVLNARVVNGLRVSGLSWEFGLNYQFEFKSPNKARILSVGATYSPSSEVRAFQDLLSFSYTGSFYRGQTVIIGDSVEFIQDNKGFIFKPEEYAVGFEYRFNPYKSNSSMRVGVDLRMEKWSSFYTSFSDVKDPGGLKDRTSVSIGFERAPNKVTLLDPDTPFLSTLTYRFGFNYIQTELQLENNLGEMVAIDNYGMSFGLGLPILAGISNTNINFGASFGNLGTTENGIIQESYMGLYFGLSITPLKSNRWFVKRKYN